MARKDSIQKMHEVLVKRRDALRRALAGDLSLLKQLREQSGSDVVDAALDAAQDEISSKLAEVESRELRAHRASARKHAAGHVWQLRDLFGQDPARPPAGPSLRDHVH